MKNSSPRSLLHREWSQTAGLSMAILLCVGLSPVAPAALTSEQEAYAKSVTEIVGEVANARLKFLDAQANLCDALGLKTQAAIKLSEAKRAIDGATSTPDKITAIKDSIVVSSNANAMLKQGMAEAKELSAESKDKFSQGTAKWYEGSLLEKAQLETLQNLVTKGKALAQSAPPLEKPKVLGLAKPVTTLASLVPGDFKEGTITLSSIAKFAKKQNITIPSEDKIMALLSSSH